MRFLLGLIILILISAFAMAYELIPSSLQFTANQSQTINGNFIINNTGVTDISFTFLETFNLTGTYDHEVIGVTFQPSSPFIVPANITQSVSFKFTLPQYMYAGSYNGAFYIYDNESNSTKPYQITLNLNEAKNISVPSSLSFGDVYYNQTPSQQFTITNTGNVNLTNIQVKNNADPKYGLTFTPSTISTLQPGGTSSITASIHMPFDSTVRDDLKISDLIINYAGSDVDVGDITLNVKNYLSLKKIRTKIEDKTQSINKDGEDIEENAQPLEKVEIDVEVENLYDEIANKEIEIEDVVVKVTAIAIDKDAEDIELESDSVDLNYEGNDKRHTFNFDFNVPMEAEDDTYDIEVELTGTDEDDNDFSTIWTIELTVDRESHDLIISDYTINPEELSCARNAVVDFEIVNIGKSDEDYVRYTLINNDLGINLVKSRFEIFSEPEDDENRYKVSIPLQLKNAAEGTYPIELRVYRDFDILEDIATKNLVVGACEKSTPPKEESKKEEEKPPVIEEEEEKELPKEEVVEEQEELKLPLPRIESPANQPTLIGVPLGKTASFRNSKYYISSLIFANVGLAVIIFLILIVYSRMG